MVAGIGQVRDLLALARQGHWTNDPNDPFYARHWNMRELAADEVITQVYPGTMGGRFRGGLVNVRVADGPHGRVVYVDKPKIPRLGPVAKVIGNLGDRVGTFTPARYENASIQVNPAAGRVRIATDDGLINARSDVHVGRSADLSPRDQLRNSWRIIRG